MKVCALVYSQTGNTYSVVKRLNETVNNKIDILNINIKEEKYKSGKEFNIDKVYDIDKYDTVIIASFVEAFLLSRVMEKYIKETNFNNKKVFILVTQYFPFKFLGGNRTADQIKKIIKIDPEECSIINWSKKNKEEQILDTIKRFKNKLNM